MPVGPHGDHAHAGQPTVTLDGTTPAPITFTATGTFANRPSATLPGSMLTWTVRARTTRRRAPHRRRCATPANVGGVVTVTVADGCTPVDTASTTVTFVINTTVGTPQNPGQWAGAPTTTGTVPTILYPSDQTRFPRNIYGTLFQWHLGSASYTQFRLTFSGPGGTVIVYTDGVDPSCAGKTPAAGCWLADATTWQFVAGSNAGQTVTWVVDALDTTGAAPVIRESVPITLGFSKRDVTGAVFYWSTTSSGIRRANITASAPEEYIAGNPATAYASPSDTVQCVACHAVPRDASDIAAARAIEEDQKPRCVSCK